MLKIETFCLGDWQTNCYVLQDIAGHEADQNGSDNPGKSGGGGGECWIVDAGFYPAPMLSFIHEHDLVPTRVVLTHGHVDHIAGLAALRAVWPDLPIYIHEAEADFLTDPRLNLSAALSTPVVAPSATELLQHGQTLTLGDTTLQLIHTPGHSPGGLTLYDAGSASALVGDALFSGSVGRTDFPTSDGDLLLRSIRERLYVLPDATTVYAGHGPTTTIGREKVGNPYVQGA